MRFLYPWALLLGLAIPLLALALLYRRPNRPGARRIVPLALRTLAVLCLVIAAAGSQLVDPSTGMDVVFVVDVSDSVGPDGRIAARRFVDTALTAARPEDRAGIVLVGRESAVERGLQSELRSLTEESVLDTSATSLEDGILRALSLFSENKERRIVVLSDGQETTGDAVSAARVARDAGVTVLAVPLSSSAASGEVFIRSVDAPSNVRVDEVHELEVVIAAASASSATVTVLRDDAYYGEDRVQLGPGDNVVTFQSAFSDEGVHRYTVTVDTRNDPIKVNNEAEVLVRATSEPSILYVAGDPAPSVVRALDEQGIRVRSVLTENMPSDINEMISYDAIVFDNVPAFDLSITRMESIERYVRDTGGGFVMIGGDASFGAGGYFSTPVERLLPVDMDVTSAMKVPSLALVFVIDKSGSMGSVEINGLTKLDLVKEAVLASVEIMNEFYSVGLLAFDADFEWTVPLMPAGNRARIASDLSSLSPGGGTVLEGALQEARRTLADTDAAVKHLIVLSDGLTNDGNFEEIVNDMADELVTVSTVSIGSSSDRELMGSIAKWGGGRSYHAADTSSVPRIFTSETTIVSRNLVVEEDFIPTVSGYSPIIQGIEGDEIPPLRGFVLTYQKTGAQQVLSGTGNNPLLSAWQYGLGRSVAFTSDLRARWAQDWLGWPGYQQILAQMVRWSQRPAGESGFRVGFDQKPDSTTIEVDAVQPNGSFRNLLELSARVQQPGGNSTVMDLVQVGPGRYEAEVGSAEPGSYLVTLYGASGVPPTTYGFAVPFAPEYTRFQTDFQKLQDMGEAGNGSVLQTGQTRTVFLPSLSGQTYRDTIWMILVVIAISALILELIFKKLIMPVGTVVTSFRREEVRPRDSKKREHRAGAAASVSYEDIRKQVAESYRREAREKRTFGGWRDGGEHNPVAERKIHIARKRRD